MITPRDGTVVVVAGTPDTDLWAVVGPRTFAAEQIRAAWDAGAAVTALDPSAPLTVQSDLLAQLRPTHLVDADGVRRFPGGTPVAAGTAAGAEGGGGDGALASS